MQTFGYACMYLLFTGAVMHLILTTLKGFPATAPNPPVDPAAIRSTAFGVARVIKTANVSKFNVLTLTTKNVEGTQKFKSKKKIHTKRSAHTPYKRRVVQPSLLEPSSDWVVKA